MNDQPVPCVTEKNWHKTPNYIGDELLRYINGNELMVLMYAVRTILGWNDYEHGVGKAISLTEFEAHTSLSRPTISKVLKMLKQCKILIAIGKPTKNGQKWDVGQNPDMECLKNRKQVEKQKYKQKMKKVRVAVKRINQNSTDKQSIALTNTVQIERKMGIAPAVNHINQNRLMALTGNWLMALTLIKDSTLKTSFKDKNQGPPGENFDIQKSSQTEMLEWKQLWDEIAEVLESTGYDVTKKSTKGLISKIRAKFKDVGLTSQDVKPLMRDAYKCIKKAKKRSPLIGEYLWNSHFAEYQKQQNELVQNLPTESDPRPLRFTYNGQEWWSDDPNPPPWLNPSKGGSS